MINVSRKGLRIFGGSGFSFDGLSGSLHVSISPNEKAELSGVEPQLHDSLVQMLSSVTVRFALKPASIQVVTYPRAHIGLGSGTGLHLACLTALFALNDRPSDQQTLVKLSGRGGTSGIGVHTFFHGGFAIDVGHPHGTVNLAPSSFNRSAQSPPIVTQLTIPPDWRIHLFLGNGDRLFGAEEQAFFESSSLAEEDQDSVASSTLLGIAAAVATSDLGLLREALMRISTTGFKAAEVDRQGLRPLLHEINAMPSVAAGMSSMGPLIYVLTHDNIESSSMERLHDLAREFEAAYLGSFSMANSGYILE